MKTFVLSLLLFVLFTTGSSAQAHARMNPKNDIATNDTIRIANDSLEYEIVIIDPKFNAWLTSRARPRNYYGIAFLENRNLWLVSEWNRRVLEPMRYNPNLYELRIDYQSNIRYGYEVNYLLYNYFLFFQQEYRQKLR
ncbi:DUF6146 family protein [Flavobacterium sp.]|uniref:DUF6146 family protein n=1 Tax=Flavobacterium sp. TaxID=239 RepID=UPI0039E2C89C